MTSRRAHALGRSARACRRLGRSRGAAALMGVLVAVLVAALLPGCGNHPPAPDWQLNAQSALQRAVQARLTGSDRVAEAEATRARNEITATGRPELMARVELLLCATRTAELAFEPCAGFERLRADAAAPELAYASYLAGTLDPAQLPLLPPAQQPLAGAVAATPAADLARLQAVADPLSRLVGAALWLRGGRATPEVLALAVDTASAQGWRRPLLAWLQVQRQRALQAGRADEAARLQRRIELVLEGR